MTELEWVDFDSSTVARGAYDPAAEVIYVQFHEGAIYLYEACPPHVWAEFTAPGQSAGKYIHDTLNHKPYRKLDS